MSTSIPSSLPSPTPLHENETIASAIRRATQIVNADELYNEQINDNKSIQDIFLTMPDSPDSPDSAQPVVPPPSPATAPGIFRAAVALSLPPRGTYKSSGANAVRFNAPGATFPSFGRFSPRDNPYITPIGRRPPPPQPRVPRRRTQRRTEQGNPSVSPTPRVQRANRLNEDDLSTFQILDVLRFGQPGSKAIVLGTVEVGADIYHLVNLTNFNRFTGCIGPGGIRLFVEQFTKILKNANTITETLRAIQRNEIVASQILLGDGVYSYVCSEPPYLDIRYYKHAFARENPTDIYLNMGIQEWEDFVQRGLEMTKKLQQIRRRILPTPIQGDKERFYKV